VSGGLSLIVMCLALGGVLLHTLFFGLSMRRKGQRGLLGALALCAANAAAFVYLLISR
jgi:hypothetical protein